MKKLIFTVIFALFLTTTFATIKSHNSIDVFSQTTNEITKLLNPRPSDDVLDQEIIVKVVITLNGLNELVVLQVDGDNALIKEYIKNALNYKKLNSNELVKGKDYAFEVRFKL
jgi:hypothetical protein